MQQLHTVFELDRLSLKTKVKSEYAQINKIMPTV